MPKLPKQPRPADTSAVRQAWTEEHSLARLLVAGPGSALGRYPVGNTGDANVSAVAAMPIPADLQAVLVEKPTAS
jgi:anti-sigma factor RsiW